MISPYKGLARPPSTPILSQTNSPSATTGFNVPKLKLNRPLFLEDTHELVTTPPSAGLMPLSPFHIIPFNTNGNVPTLTAPTSPTPLSSPPHEMRQKVDRILHEALQLRSSIEGLGTISHDEELTFASPSSQQRRVL